MADCECISAYVASKRVSLMGGQHSSRGWLRHLSSIHLAAPLPVSTWGKTRWWCACFLTISPEVKIQLARFRCQGVHAEKDRSWPLSGSDAPLWKGVLGCVRLLPVPATVTFLRKNSSVDSVIWMKAGSQTMLSVDRTFFYESKKY